MIRDIAALIAIVAFAQSVSVWGGLVIGGG